MAKAQLPAEIGDQVQILKAWDERLGLTGTIIELNNSGDMLVQFEPGKSALYTPDEVILLVD